MKFKVLRDGKVTDSHPFSWPCQSCGMTVSGALKTRPRSAGKGLRTVVGTFKEVDTDTLKIKSIQTKAGPLTIVSKHLPNV